MSSIAQLANEWPPLAGGSKQHIGGEFCLDTKAGVLKQVFAVGTSVGLKYECNGNQLHSSVLYENEELAREVTDLLMRHLGERLEPLGMLEVRCCMTN